MNGTFRDFFVALNTFICSHQPNIIVDFIFDRGLFFISIKNAGKRSAYQVSVKFNNEIIGVDGTKEVSAQSLFRNIEFLPPEKEIVTFLDTSASYFKKGNPSKIAANVTFSDREGRKFDRVIQHDLDIYRDIGFVDRQHRKKRIS
jgi:hypothetical protein